MHSRKTEAQNLMQQANAALQNKQPQVAGPMLQKVLQLEPNNIDAAEQLGLAAFQTQQNALAENLWLKILEVDKKRVRARYMLANMYAQIRKDELAIQHYLEVIKIKPSMVEAHNNLGLLYKNNEQYAQAVSCFEKVVSKNPKSAFALSNLGNVLKDSGRFEEAVKVLERAVKADKTMCSAYSNLLVSLNYRDSWTPKKVADKHRNWVKHLPPAIKTDRFKFKDNELDVRRGQIERTERKLRLGFVSPDLHRHSVAYFVSPLFKHIDRSRIDLYAYYNNNIQDDVQQELARHCLSWKQVDKTGDHDLAEQIYRDQIDILIDLAGHTANNRLAVFAQKPCPIQVTWLGYPNTTGLEQIDYRITDALTDPLPDSQALNTETLIHMPNGFLCFGAPEKAPELASSPCLKKGYLTFGSFNNLHKVTPKVIVDWASLMNSVPNSRMVIKSRQLGDIDVKAWLLKAFSKHGIQSERLDLLAFVPGLESHLSVYESVDVALDTYPYNGTTTTCEALWMGVPVMSLSGAVHAARVGVSLLNSVGLEALVFDNVDSMKRQLQAWQEEPSILNELRLSLRERMQSSALCKPLEFAKEFERILFGMLG